MKLGSFWARSQRSVQIDTWSSFCSAVRRRDTNFTVTRLICKSLVRIFWHVPNAVLTSSATSLIVRRWSARMISCTRATVSLVWEMDGLPGRGSSSKDQRPLLKWEYHSNVFYRLRQDSSKAACSISYVSAPVFPSGNRNRCTRAAALFSPSWDATHTAGRHSVKGFCTANAGRYQIPVLHIHLHRVATCPTLLPLLYVL